MNFNKVRAFCRGFRIVMGINLIIIGLIYNNYWFLLGVIPMFAGIINFCPLCIISKKCELPKS